MKFPYKQGVAGSSPVASTTTQNVVIDAIFCVDNCVLLILKLEYQRKKKIKQAVLMSSIFREP